MDVDRKCGKRDKGGDLSKSREKKRVIITHMEEDRSHETRGKSGAGQRKGIINWCAGGKASLKKTREDTKMVHDQKVILERVKDLTHQIGKKLSRFS